jgi:protein-tyrosine-phosphatase
MMKIIDYIFRMKILFVCTANICRSAMAEGLFKRQLSMHSGTETIQVRSSGVDALVGLTPDRNTKLVCNKQGVHIDSHKACQLTKTLLKEADLVLCMSKDHRQRILDAFPKIDKNIFLLKEYLREHPISETSVKDPTGKSIKHYETCFREIEKEIKRIFPAILLWTKINNSLH